MKIERVAPANGNGHHQLADLDVERSVLAALLLSADGVSEVRRTLDPGDFFHPSHEIVFRAILDTYDTHGITDVIQVRELLASRGQLERIGGRDTLLEIAGAELSAARLSYNVQLVAGKARRRRIEEHLRAAAARVRTEDPDELLRNLRSYSERELEQAASGATRSPRAVVERWRERGPLVHIETGIAALDAQTNGGPVFGSVWFVIGAPDAGKTGLVVQLADQWASGGVPVAILAVDEEDDGITTRLLQRRGWPRGDIERRRSLDVMQEDLSDLDSLQIYGADWTIERAAEELAARAGGRPGVLIVDSLQTVTSDSEADLSSVRDQVTARVRAMKAAAARHGLLIIITSEMGRGFYRDAKAARDLDDMAAGKESGAIEYGARVLLSLRSVPDERDLVELRIPKNKQGPRTRPDDGGIFLRLDRANQRFTEAADYQPTVEGRQVAGGRARQQQVADAALLAALIAGHPGSGVRELRSEARVRAGSMSQERFDDAIRVLGAALVIQSGPNRCKQHYLNGAAVPAEVLQVVELKDRPMVAAAQAWGAK